MNHLVLMIQLHLGFAAKNSIGKALLVFGHKKRVRTCFGMFFLFLGGIFFFWSVGFVPAFFPAHVVWLGGVFVVVWWCFCGVPCGGVFGVFVVVCFCCVVGWCFCGGVCVVWLCFCGGVVVFLSLWWCFCHCGDVFVLVFLW